MQVIGYCRRCPLNADPLADVRGRQCPWGCKDARAEHPSIDVSVREPKNGDEWSMCSGCGTVTPTARHVLDVLVSCRSFKTNGCSRKITVLKGTGSWLSKWWVYLRLPSQVKADRRASGLRP